MKTNSLGQYIRIQAHQTEGVKLDNAINRIGFPEKVRLLEKDLFGPIQICVLIEKEDVYLQNRPG